MSTPQPAPDFGEPWDASAEYVYGRDDKEVHLYPHRLRIAQCANACAGMSDPAAEIQVLRDAVKEASTTLENCYQVHRAITLYAPQSEADKAANREHCEKIRAALAKLKALA